MSFEQVAQLPRAAEFLEDIGAQLNPGKSQRGNVLNRLAVIPIPGDGCVTEVNFAGRGGNRRIEVRQIHRGIEPFGRAQLPKGESRTSSGCGRDCSYPLKKLAAQHST